MEENGASIFESFLQLSSAGIIAGLITAAVLFYPLFKNTETFIACVMFWLKPNRWGNVQMFGEEWWGETRIILWLVLSIAMAYGTDSFLVN